LCGRKENIKEKEEKKECIAGRERKRKRRKRVSPFSHPSEIGRSFEVRS
jgi:hypothetical protein